jgi:hypothetical protein
MSAKLSKRVTAQRGQRGLMTLAFGVMALAVTGCTTTLSDTSSQYFPKTRLLAPPPPPITGNVLNPNQLPPSSISGKVDRPNPALTPGAVVSTDVNAVCAGPRSNGAPVTTQTEQALFAEYNIPWPLDKLRYHLNYLIPLDLGGAANLANLWPISVRGLSSHQKGQLDALLRARVCQGQVALAEVQQGYMKDWYGLWIRFGQ